MWESALCKYSKKKGVSVMVLMKFDATPLICKDCAHDNVCERLKDAMAFLTRNQHVWVGVIPHKLGCAQKLPQKMVNYDVAEE